MDFLSNNPSVKLKPVQPTEEQLSIFYYLFEKKANNPRLVEDIIGIKSGKDEQISVGVYSDGERIILNRHGRHSGFCHN